MTRKVSAVALALAAALTLLPIALLLWQSIQTHDGIGLNQYEDILANPRYWNNYKNSLILTLGSLACALPVGVLTGMWMAFARRRVLAMYFLAMMLPFQVIMLPLFQLAVQAGLRDTHAAIILLNAFAPLSALVCWAFIRQMDQAQWDAVLLETNSAFVIITKILLPQMVPGLLALVLLVWSECWNMVEQPLILLQSEALQPLSLYCNDILGNPSGPAGAVLYALPVLVMYGGFAWVGKAGQSVL